MPVLDRSDPKWRTYYDVLDAVRQLPGVFLGGVDDSWVQGTRMPRLQAFLSGLQFASLEQGDPPFVDFGPWFTVRFEPCPNAHTLPFHWLEEHERSADSAFDTFFKYLDEFRRCRPEDVCSTAGPFSPAFRVGLDDAKPPERPKLIKVKRYGPSEVYFFQEQPSEDIRRRPFFRTLREVKTEVTNIWGVPEDGWQPI